MKDILRQINELNLSMEINAKNNNFKAWKSNALKLDGLEKELEKAIGKNEKKLAKLMSAAEELEKDINVAKKYFEKGLEEEKPEVKPEEKPEEKKPEVKSEEKEPEVKQEEIPEEKKQKIWSALGIGAVK